MHQINIGHQVERMRNGLAGRGGKYRRTLLNGEVMQRCLDQILEGGQK